MTIHPIVKVRSTEYYVLVHCHERESHSHCEPSYFVSTSFCCLNHSSQPIRVEIGENDFYVYEDGQREKCTRNESLSYLGRSGEKLVACVKGNLFHIQKKTDANATCGGLCSPPRDDEYSECITYQNWNNIPISTTIAQWVTD